MDIKQLNKIEKMRAEAKPLQFEPMPGVIIVRLFDPEAFKKSKLHLPDGTRERPSEVYKEMPLQGIVVAKGAEYVNDLGQSKPVPVQVGDHVCVDGQRGMMEFIFNGVKYAWLRQSDIIGIYRGVEVPMVTRWLD